MRIFTLFFAFILSLPALADDNTLGGFIIAPMNTERFATYGDCIAPCESESGNTSYVSGPHVILTPFSSTTGVENVNILEDKQYYCIQGGSLKALQSAAVYSLDGKAIARVKANGKLDLSIMPEMFVIKFGDSVSFKVAKTK